jgi:hypothetical protein
MKRTLLSIFAMTLFLIMAPIWLFAQSPSQLKIIEVVGTGSVHGDNVSYARDEAISNGLVMAVGLVVSDLVSFQTIVEKFPTLNQTVYSKADQFVQGYKVLTETARGKKYRVLVQATVSVDRIQEKLSQSGMPLEANSELRVLLLIAEQNLEDHFPRYWWGESYAFVEAISEGQLAAAMVSQGFSVIDRFSMEKSPFSELAKPPNYNLDNTQAAEIGRLFQADIVVVGSAMAESAPNLMGEDLKSYKGTLSVRALRIETQVEIASLTQTALSTESDDISGGRKALAAVGVKAGTILASQIHAAWQNKVGKSQTFEILVEGTRQLVHFVKFRTIVADLPLVNELQTKEIMPDKATLEVEFQGSTQQFAEALLLKSFEPFGIHINQVTPEQIRLSLVAQ